MESKCCILKLEKIRYHFNDAILLIANPVEIDNTSFKARLFRKPFYKYSENISVESLYLIYPYSVELKNHLRKEKRKCKHQEFFSVDLSNYNDDYYIHEGVRLKAFINKAFKIEEKEVEDETFKEEINISDEVIRNSESAIEEVEENKEASNICDTDNEENTASQIINQDAENLENGYLQSSVSFEEVWYESFPFKWICECIDNGMKKREIIREFNKNMDENPAKFYSLTYKHIGYKEWDDIYRRYWQNDVRTTNAKILLQGELFNTLRGLQINQYVNFEITCEDNEIKMIFNG